MSPDMTILTMSKGVSVVNVCTDRLRGLVVGVEPLSTNRGKKSKKKEQPLLRLPRWSPTLVLTELDGA